MAGWGFARVLEPSAALWPVLLGALVPALLLAVASLAGRAVGRPTPPATITVPSSLLLAGVAGPPLADRLAANMARAAESLDSGAARDVLDRWVAFSRS